MRRFTSFEWVLIALAIIGAINWGLVGFFQFDLVAAIFGRMSTLSRIIYALVGLAGLGLLIDAVARPRAAGHDRDYRVIRGERGVPTT
jgi:uncharacterized protein